MTTPFSSSSAQNPTTTRFSRPDRRVPSFASAPAIPPRPRFALARFRHAPVADPAEDVLLQMWTPGLLDRLKVPLTRYHE